MTRVLRDLMQRRFERLKDQLDADALVALGLVRQLCDSGDDVDICRAAACYDTFLEDETMSVIIRYLSRGYIREVVIDIGRSALSSN